MGTRKGSLSLCGHSISTAKFDQSCKSALIARMQPSEALGITAQVAVTLAGFAGIVVVFRPESVHRWSAIDKFRLQLLLTNSALPLGYSLLGLLFLSLGPPPAAIWRWCSGIGFAVQIFVIAYTGNPRRRISRGP